MSFYFRNLYSEFNQFQKICRNLCGAFLFDLNNFKIHVSGFHPCFIYGHTECTLFAPEFFLMLKDISFASFPFMLVNLQLQLLNLSLLSNYLLDELAQMLYPQSYNRTKDKSSLICHGEKLIWKNITKYIFNLVVIQE